MRVAPKRDYDYAAQTEKWAKEPITKDNSKTAKKPSVKDANYKAEKCEGKCDCQRNSRNKQKSLTRTLLVVRVGTDEFPATNDDVKDVITKLKDLFAQANDSDQFVFVTNQRLSVQSCQLYSEEVEVDII